MCLSREKEEATGRKPHSRNARCHSQRQDRKGKTSICFIGKRAYRASPFHATLLGAITKRQTSENQKGRRDPAGPSCHSEKMGGTQKRRSAGGGKEARRAGGKDAKKRGKLPLISSLKEGEPQISQSQDRAENPKKELF